MSPLEAELIASLARPLLLLAALAWVGAPPYAEGAGYENLLEQGTFYLSRGATYGPEAVRTLERARETAPDRAAVDPQWLGAMARAYTLTARYTEAFWLLESLGRVSERGGEDEALRERLLGETGLGRLRLRSAVPLTGLTAVLVTAEGTRLDVTSRKALERLNELLSRGLDVEEDGLVLLAPEGRYVFQGQAPGLHGPREPLNLEVWAGDEVTLRLIPRYPDSASWIIRPRSRSIEIAWPALEGASYRLYRQGEGGEELLYRGSEARYVDAALEVGVSVGYRLETLNPSGEVIGVSLATGRTLPPVSQVRVEASLERDLEVRVTWAMGGGAADEVRVLREGPVEALVTAYRAGEVESSGQIADGPFRPGTEAEEVTYRVEAWVEGAGSPAASGRAVVEIPAQVIRVTEVAETIDRGVVVVVWETLPREGAAEGFLIYRQGGDEIAGERVGEIADPFAREFEYPVEDPLAASSWRHFVVPYVGDRVLLDPRDLEFGGREPEQDLEKRRRMGEILPDVGLSWDAYPGARLYAVTIGEREVLVRKPFVELKGLQNALMETGHRVTVHAVDRAGERIPLLSVDLHYEHYPRGRGGGEER